jgi:uncharacterized membrane protein YgcG
VSSHAPLAVAQQPTPEALNEFLKAAAKAGEAREKELAEIRLMLNEVLRRNRALEDQLQAAMEMQAQALAIQTKNLTDEVKGRVVDEAKKLATQGREALDTAVNELKKGTSEPEKKLSATVEKLKSLIPSDEEIETMGKEKFEELQKEIQKVKQEVETEIRDYATKLAEEVRSKCPKANADTATLVAAAQRGATNEELRARATQIGCEVGSDLLEKLANARNAEEAKAAFQSSMTSMMMLAIYSGNPYVIAAVAIIALVAALFSDGGGGSGSGEGEGASEGGAEKVAGGGGQNGDDASSPDIQAPETPQPGAGGGSSTELQIQSGTTGCTVEVDAAGDTLTIVPEVTYFPYSIKLSSIQGQKPDNLPPSWKDKNLTLSKCDGSSQSLYVWLHLSPQASPLCYVFYKKEDAYFIGDQAYAVAHTNKTCEPL